jgi:DNA-binding NarL/FixJ family response regulator
MSDQPAAAPGLKLLLVEDSPRLQAILAESVQAVPGLELAGVAATAADAMIAFASHGPDVVILDLVLRAGSGLDVLREIKQRAPACQVLVFTGYDMEPCRTRCLAAGADHFFSKNRQHRELMHHLHHLSAGANPCDREPAHTAPGLGSQNKNTHV